MDFRLTEAQQEMQSAARAYAQDKLPELADHIERTAEPPTHELIKEYAEMGFLGINIPEALGGLGQTSLDALIVLEEFGKISSAIAFPVFESCTGPVKAIEHFGTEARKQRVVPAVCAGEMVVAIAMSEPNAGSALTDLTTRAEVGRDSVRINGMQRWCSGGGHADGYLVYCRMSDDPGAKGIGAVFIEKDTKGVSFGEQEHLMGFRGVPSSDIFLDDVEIPIDNVVVGAGGFKKLMQAFDLERCGNATMSMAQAAGALDEVIERLRAGAQTVRQTHHRLPGCAAAARRDADAGRRRAPAHPPCDLQCRGGHAQHPGKLDRQVLRQRDFTHSHRQRRPAHGRLWLLQGVPHRTPHARRLGLGHRRRCHRYPEDQHRERDGGEAV